VGIKPPKVSPTGPEVTRYALLPPHQIKQVWRTRTIAAISVEEIAIIACFTFIDASIPAGIFELTSGRTAISGHAVSIIASLTNVDATISATAFE
tara:strand:+ start:51 stop:335 length:285 start_codon:yes stop_codon:yes gene_type:complete